MVNRIRVGAFDFIGQSMGGITVVPSTGSPLTALPDRASSDTSGRGVGVAIVGIAITRLAGRLVFRGSTTCPGPRRCPLAPHSVGAVRREAGYRVLLHCNTHCIVGHVKPVGWGHGLLEVIRPTALHHVSGDGGPRVLGHVPGHYQCCVCRLASIRNRWRRHRHGQVPSESPTSRTIDPHRDLCRRRECRVPHRQRASSSSLFPCSSRPSLTCTFTGVGAVLLGHQLFTSSAVAALGLVIQGCLGQDLPGRLVDGRTCCSRALGLPRSPRPACRSECLGLGP